MEVLKPYRITLILIALIIGLVAFCAGGGVVGFLLISADKQPAAAGVTEIVQTQIVETKIAITQVIITQIAITQVAEAPTATLEVPTATVEPTRAPLIFSSTVTPQDVINAFKAMGLEAENVRAMTKDDYGLSPMASEGMRFYIPSLGADKGGRVMYYDDPAILQAAKTYYEELGKSSAIFFSWVFVNGNILVQINGELPEEQAVKYESALLEVK